MQEILQKVRATIREAAPSAEETIKYQMPTFTLKGNLVYFGGFKKHVGFYPVPNPFPEAQADHKTLHFYFLESVPPAPDLALLAALKTEREQFKLIETVFYLHAPDGIGRSKLAEKVEKALGVAATARNWRTVSKMMEMATAVTR